MSAVRRRQYHSLTPARFERTPHRPRTEARPIRRTANKRKKKPRNKRQTNIAPVIHVMRAISGE